LRRTIEKELSNRTTGITKKYSHAAVGRQKLPWYKSKKLMRLFISQEEIVVCGTFASGGAQCHVIRSIKPMVAEYTSLHSAFSTFRLSI